MREAFFAIRDGSKRKAKPCAFMKWTAAQGFKIDIVDGVSSEAVPAFFVPFVNRKELSLTPEMSAEWVSERIPPSGRQNLGEILDAHSLSEYSELELIRSGKGESSQDSFIVQEIDAESYERREVDKAAARRRALGKAIKERRVNLGMSQRELADELGISQPALSKIEAGKANITFDLLTEIDDCLSGDEPSFLRIPEANLWTRERSAMKRGLEVVNPGHATAYESLINLLEELADAEQPSEAAKHELALLCEDYFRSLCQIAEDFKCAEEDEGELKGLCDGMLAKGADAASLRDQLARKWDGDSWQECLAAILQAEPFQKEYISSFYEEHREFLALLANANRVNAAGGYEDPLSEQISRLMEFVDSQELYSLAMRELKNPRWRDEVERYEYAVVELDG